MPSLTRTVASGTPEPVTVDEFRNHIKSDTDDEDIALLGYLMAARRGMEEEYATALVPQTCVLRLDRFPTENSAFTYNYGEIELRIAHVTSITSIQYIDTDGATQTLAGANYTADVYSTPARIRPAYGLSWPATRLDMNAVTVTFVAGYATPADVPFNVKAALLLLAAELNDKREPTVTGATIAAVPGFESLAITERWGGYAGSRT
jgi:uncharacterized phiE125 gp8 family phage protein